MLFLHLCAGFRIGEVVLRNLGKLDFKENLQPIVPDGIAEPVKGSHPNLIGAAANHQAKEIQTPHKVAVIVQQDADDLGAFSKVYVGVLSLGAAHGGRVNLIALGDQFSHLLGEHAIDIVLIHGDTSS